MTLALGAGKAGGERPSMCVAAGGRVMRAGPRRLPIYRFHAARSWIKQDHGQAAQRMRCQSVVDARAPEARSPSGRLALGFRMSRRSAAPGGRHASDARGLASNTTGPACKQPAARGRSGGMQPLAREHPRADGKVAQLVVASAPGGEWHCPTQSNAAPCACLRRSRQPRSAPACRTAERNRASVAPRRRA